MNSNENDSINVYIGTHDGNFHADDVLACNLLKRLPEYCHASVVRTRNSQILDKCDVVVDVGGVYDPVRHRYDHHQRGFNETFDDKNYQKIKLSSAGLVYKHFGKRIVAGACASCGVTSEESIHDIYVTLYARFIEEIDAIDNGIDNFEHVETDSPIKKSPLYIQSSSLSARVSRSNAFWNENYSADAQMSRFEEVMTTVGYEFDSMLFRDILGSWLPGKGKIIDAMKRNPHPRSSPEILIFSEYCPWKDHIHDIEKNDDTYMKTGKKILFVLYPEDNNRSDTRWRVQSVNIAPGSFVSRLPLHPDWRGLGGAELSRVAGFPGCGFVHAAGFLGSHDNIDGALEMAKRSILHSVGIKENGLRG